ESSGIFAIESAMDELAVALNVDPVALRLRNEPQQDEFKKLPFSSRSTRECYRVAAERFGWSKRNPKPRSMRDGRWLIGWGMASAGEAACRKAREDALARVGSNDLADAMRRIRQPIEATADVKPGDEGQRFSMHAFGAVFVEVAVDPDLGETRVRRIVGAYGAGRIVNPKTARSQCIGGMIGGIGMALMEHSVVAGRNGRVTNANFAESAV